MHKISEFIKIVKDEQLYISDTCKEDVEIRGLTYNSKQAGAGTLFVCKGAAFKEEYLKSAAEKGAVVYISEIEYPDVSLPHIIVSDIRKAMPYLAFLFYDDPAKTLKLTGITGTKGKSTTVYYFKTILDMYQESLGKPVTGITSTIDTYDGVENFESHNTTPEALELYSHFYNAAKSELEYFTVEVSAQALKYDRVDLVTFDAGVFMNISEDHISPVEHPDFEDYFTSKLMLFKQTKKAFICTNTDNFDRIEEAAKAAEEYYTFGMEPECDLYGYDIKKEGDSIFFKVKCSEHFRKGLNAENMKFDREFELTMPGLFNVDNALAAICVASSYGIPEEFMYEGLRRARSKGRMELFKSADNKVYVIVDYAHNKLSFEKLYKSVKGEYGDRKIFTVFGCPGTKAVVRRRDLGTLAGENSDRIYLVPEDPGTEELEKIHRETAMYIEATNTGCPYETFDNRGDAIRKAIFDCTEPTVILITGKGGETRQLIEREYIDCPSDSEFAKMYIKEYDEACRSK